MGVTYKPPGGQRQHESDAGQLSLEKLLIACALLGIWRRANGMNEETRKKYQRLNDRLNELSEVEG